MEYKRSCGPLQTLAFLSCVDDCESDGGEERSREAEDDSDVEFHLALSTDEEAGDTSDEENCPPAKKRFVTQDNTHATSIKAKDGTVWEKADVREHVREPSTDAKFSETAGPTEHAKCRTTSRLQSFLCLIDSEMLKIITDCTVHEGRRSDSAWNLSVSELMAFIAVLFLRATLCPVGAMMESWSEKYAIPAIKNTMARDRYNEIMRYLRFDDKNTRAERVKSDRFAAISDVWQRFVRNCDLCYTPGRHIIVEEQLFPTKVRCPFLQYSATTPYKFGIKFWAVRDLKTSYMCNAAPYLGRDASLPKGEQVSDSVVTKLLEPFMDKGRSVITDVSCTSLSLASKLLERNTTLLGAIDTSQQEVPPPARSLKGRKEFSTEVYRSGGATLTVYASRKNKSVCVLSTTHKHVQTGSGQKRKPNTVMDYSRMKGSVDQKACAYTVRAGTRRWPVAVFYNMLNLAVMNAHVLYKACTGATERRRDFMHSLAEELRRCFLQEKAMAEKQRGPLAPGKTTQCQVRTHCHRNHSTERCVECGKFTCRKCRKVGPWVCSKC